jgi:hypothetical protein
MRMNGVDLTINVCVCLRVRMCVHACMCEYVDEIGE